MIFKREHGFLEVLDIAKEEACVGCHFKGPPLGELRSTCHKPHYVSEGCASRNTHWVKDVTPINTGPKLRGLEGGS